MSNCIVCNKQLPAWFKGDICSAKCRKKKSRDKLMAGQRAHKISFEIDAITSSMKRSEIEKDDAEKIFYTIWGSLSKMHDHIKGLPEPEEEA